MLLQKSPVDVAKIITHELRDVIYFKLEYIYFLIKRMLSDLYCYFGS